MPTEYPTGPTTAPILPGTGPSWTPPTATPPPPDEVKALQTQINRFGTHKLPVTGVVDQATADAAIMLYINRYLAGYLHNPTDADAKTAYLNATMIKPSIGFVSSNVAQLTSTIRFFADSQGRLGLPWANIAIVGAAIAALAAFFSWRR